MCPSRLGSHLEETVSIGEDTATTRSDRVDVKLRGLDGDSGGGSLKHMLVLFEVRIGSLDLWPMTHLPTETRHISGLQSDERVSQCGSSARLTVPPISKPTTGVPSPES